MLDCGLLICFFRVNVIYLICLWFVHASDENISIKGTPFFRGGVKLRKSSSDPNQRCIIFPGNCLWGLFLREGKDLIFW